ncbi:MAG: ubiquinol-cytochrome c reductase iron-sulfur subunit [Acidimicrobiia bacterium]
MSPPDAGPAAGGDTVGRARWRTRAAVVLALAAAPAAVAVVAALAGRPAGTVGALAAASLGVAGVGLVHAAKALPDTAEEEHPRAVHGPSLSRRRLVRGGGAALGVAAAGGASVAAAGRNEEATRALRATAWSKGVGVVTAEGEAVRADALAVGDALTVYPSVAILAADAQVMLLRLAPGTLDGDAGVGIPDGLVAYSRLCTHMACPLGLYQQRNEVLLCPCHQALFDVADGGRPIIGPASRPLPRLPLAVDGDGLLVADGPFTHAVGGGFWGRP